MIGRNDPCWCGSGKKYKKCHLQDDAKKSAAPVGTASKNKMVKSPAEIAGMRNAGAFNGRLMDYIRPFIKAGIATEAINTLVHEYTRQHGHRPASLGYRGFPKSVCVSVNNVVCHGIPSQQAILKDGDIVNVDVTTIVEGFHGDSSETFMIGEVSDDARRLVETAAAAMRRGIEAAGPGKHLRAVAEAIEPFVQSRGFSVVRQYTGHGVGRKFHEYYSVCHHITSDCENIVFLPGMTFTVEPMINAGAYDVITDARDKWTVWTKDGSLSAQFEHTLLITETGVDVLTLTPSQITAKTITILPLHE